MKKTVLFILALCLCFTIFGGTAFTENAQAETAERTEGEQAALEILTRQMTASATCRRQYCYLSELRLCADRSRSLMGPIMYSGLKMPGWRK